MSNPCDAKNYVPLHAQWRWNFFRWMVPVLLAALLLGLIGLERQYAAIAAPVIAAGPPDATTSVSGTGTPNSMVDVRLNGESVGQATVNDAGQWSLDTTTIDDAGEYQYVAYALDPEGGERGVSNDWAFTLSDAVAESDSYRVPTIAARRNNNGFALTGTGSPGTTVELFNNDVSLGMADVGNDGSWSFDTAGDPYSSRFMARGIAPDGVEIGDSDTVVYAPAALTAGAFALIGATYSWDGTGEPGSLVAVMRDGEQVGTTRVDSRGNWSFTSSARNLSAGDYLLTASVIDDDGNELMSASDDATLSIPRRALTAAESGTLAEDGATFNWGGTGEPGADVVIMLDGAEIGRTTVNDDGNWSFDGPAADLTAGDYALSAQMLDGSGDTTDEADGTLPLAAVAMAALTAGDAALAEDGATFNWGGTGEPGAEIVIMLDGEEIGRTTVNDDGNWSFDGSAADLEVGDYALSAQMLDGSGEMADEADTALSLTTVGAVKIASLIAGDATLADDGTAFNWSGTGEPGAEVVIMLDGVEIGRTTVDADGNWSFDGSAADLEAGDYALSAQMVDGSGDVTDEVNAALPLTIVGAATVASLTIGDAALADDGTAFNWSGTGEPGAEVIIMLDGVEIGRTTIDADGNWSFDGSTADLEAGDHTLSVQMLDGSGNVASEMAADTPLTTTASDDATADSGESTESASTDVMGMIQVLLPGSTAGSSSGATVTAPTGAPAVALILDSSWSMTFGIDYTGQDVGPNTDESQRLTADDPNSRIAVAKAGLIDFVENGMPSGTPTALRVFGNLRGDLQCQTDLMVPYGPLDQDAMVAIIEDVQPAFNANTTIARSLELMNEDLADSAEGNRNIVLVTDGDETCGGDPQAVIEDLVAQGFDVSVNIIGFSINDAALKSKLESWAEAGNGRFFEATDSDSLTASLTRAFAVPYVIQDASGNEVARGLVGDEAVELPVGTYTLLVRTNPTQSFDIEVVADETTTITTD